MTLVILALASLLSAIISGVVGIAGGTTLLAAMALVIPYQQIVPLHGLAQLASNSSRSFILFKSIHRSFFYFFALGVPIGGVLAYALLAKIEKPVWFQGLIAVLLLYVVFKPEKMPEIRLPSWAYGLLGVVAGFTGCLIGAVGPLLAPFFFRRDLSKEGMIATQSSCQIIVHLIKIPVFLALDFPYLQHWQTIVVTVIFVIIGTRIGTHILQRMSTELFMRVVKVVMVLIAVQLVYELATGQV